MELVDTHAHLYLNQFDDDRNDVVDRAVKNGVKRIILPNIDSSSVKSMNDLCNAYPGICFPLIGLHPTSVNETFRDELNTVKQELEKKYFGIGEIGIDLYWDKTFIREQREAFDIQLNLALEKNLPVVIHARESFSEIFDILIQYRTKNLKGIFHAFTGSVEEVNFILDNFNFYFGIGGIVTFKNSGIGDAVQRAGLQRMVLETDSPYLAPVPYRGKRNESSYLLHIAGKLSELFEVPVEEVARITTENAVNLFELA